MILIEIILFHKSFPGYVKLEDQIIDFVQETLDKSFPGQKKNRMLTLRNDVFAIILRADLYLWKVWIIMVHAVSIIVV